MMVSNRDGVTEEEARELDKGIKRGGQEREREGLMVWPECTEMYCLLVPS